MRHLFLTAIAFSLLAGPSNVLAQEVKLTLNAPDEPLAKEFSFAKAAAVLDNQSLATVGHTRQFRPCQQRHAFISGGILAHGLEREAASDSFELRLEATALCSP